MGEPLRVLIVEDMEDDAVLVAHELRRGGFEPTWERVETDEQMGAALDRQTWDVIISDYKLPRFSAPAALDVAKQSGKDIPFIVVSGTIGEEAAVTMMRAGAHDYVMKDHLTRLPEAVRREIGDAHIRAERKRAEEALRVSEEKYRELVQNANSIILRMTPDGTVTFFNEFAERFFGFAQQEILGRNVVGTIVPERESSGRDLREMILDIGRQPGRYATNENENMRRDGERVWVAWTNKGIADRNGRLTEILCVGNDVTERKRMEEQIRRAQRMESIGTLASGVAHNFNNMLGIILGNADLARLRLGESHEVAPFLDGIATAAERASHLAHQLLSIAQRGARERSLVNVRSLLESTAAALRVMMDSNIEISWRVADRVPAIHANPAEIEQAIMNLCLNARDAMPKGGTITLDAEARDLSASFCAKHEGMEPGAYVCISVRDTGTGMDRETLAKVFTPFFTTKGPDKGTGLGLYTLYGAVKKLGGCVEVESEVGKGSVFRMSLPAAAGEAQAAETRPAEALMRSGSGNVLLVDDEASILEIVGCYLVGMGYTVLTATNGREAVETYRREREKISLVILDYMMPGMDGEDTVRALRRINAHVKILAASGYDAAGRVKSLLDVGVEGFLRKPYRLVDLAQKVQGVLSSRPS